MEITMEILATFFALSVRVLFVLNIWTKEFPYDTLQAD